MDELLQKLLDEYKRLNGIDPSDTSNDSLYLMYLEAALMVAKRESCDWNKWETYDDIPGPIILGMMELIKLWKTRSDVSGSGIKSESIGGMSQSFFEIDKFQDSMYFAPALDLFGLYCSKGGNSLVFKKSKRGGCYRGR